MISPMIKSIKIMVDDKEIELTIEQAKALKEELGLMFNTNRWEYTPIPNPWVPHWNVEFYSDSSDSFYLSWVDQCPEGV